MTNTPAHAATINCTGGPFSPNADGGGFSNVVFDFDARTCVIGVNSGATSTGSMRLQVNTISSPDLASGHITHAPSIESSAVGLFQTCTLPGGVNHLSFCQRDADPLTSGTYTLANTLAGSLATLSIDVTVTGVNNITIDSGSVTIDGPEINVTGNGANITNGDVTPDSSDHTLFSGDVGLGPFTRTFTINNTGTDDLTLGANAVSVTGASSFVISAQPATSVTSGNSTTFDVTFTPLVSGVQTATISIANNDADEAPFTFNIGGDPRGPLGGTLRANGFSIIANNDLTPDAADATDFGNQDVAAGAATHTYVLSVNGFGASIFGANAVTLTGSSAFSVTQQLPLQGPNPGGLAFAQTSFQIAFDPNVNGLQTATVTMNSNIPGMNPMVFAIQGTGTGGAITAPEIAVLGNGVEITSGDTTPAVSNDTDFGNLDQTVGTLTRIFTIQNTGNGTLTLGANAVALTGSGDFSVTTQPPTTIASGGSATFNVTFDPSGLGARTATVSIANDDADEAPYTFAVSGTGVDGGNITLVQNITGPDVTAEFTSPTSALTTSLTTVNGTASRRIQNVLPGTHTVTAGNLANLGYGITSISCNDTDSTGDIASATATVNLTAGEDVTCIFTAIETREATSTLIADFLGARNTFLLANQPGSNRRIERFSSGSSQTTNGTASGFGLSGAIPIPVNATVTASTLSFSSHYAWSTPTGLNAGEANEEERKAHERDIWIEGQIAGFNDANANGTFGVIYAGADQLITPDILVGALVQYDWFSQEGDTNGSEVTGTGWMAGPYATFKLDEGFFADVRAAWGRSSNDISPTGTYTDSFDTTRWLISSALIGSYEVDKWTIQPVASLSYIRETQESYTDSLNVVIPEQSVSQGEFRAGPKLAYDIQFENGDLLTPSITIDGAYTFGNDGLYSSGSLAREVQGLRGRAGLGLDLVRTNGLMLSLGSNYDGIGTEADLFSGSLRLSMPLN